MIKVSHYRSPNGLRSELKTTVDDDKLLFHRSDDGCYTLDEGEVRLFKQLMKGRWVRVKDPEYPESEYSRDEKAAEADNCKGMKGYSSVFNNCEHYVTWILKGKAESLKVKEKIQELCGSLS